MTSNKTKYIVRVEYQNGEVWVFIRTWNNSDFHKFYQEQKSNNIKSLTVFPFVDFDKDDNTGRWWQVYNPLQMYINE